MDWTRGYSSTWRLYAVDPDTWADARELGGVTSATVERDGTGDAPLVDSGTVSLTTPLGQGWDEGYVRLALEAEQEGRVERFDVATLLATRVGGTVERGGETPELECRSVLWPASVTVMDPGSYVPAGADGAEWAAERLSEAINAPVSFEGGFTVDEHLVLDLGTTVLDAAWQVLRAGGYRIAIDGRGRVRVAPEATDVSLELSSASARMLLPSVETRLDWSGVPNRYVAVDEELVAEAVNDDPASPTSTVTRGYRVDMVDESPTRVDGETLAAYCARRLEEESVVEDARTYERKFWPGIVPGSLVRGTLPSVSMEGTMRVTRQSLDCGPALIVTETAVREVRTWQRG